MKCHYAVLGVELSASDDEIKKAYRKKALKWHPDKNIDNSEEATDQFRLVQAAYDVLSDPQEKAWYDKHRLKILHKSEFEGFKDSTSDILEFFTPSAYRGFGNDENGFYSVYGDLFKRIVEEEKRFCDDNSTDFEELPVFGDAESDYASVVHQFYAVWQSYCTKFTYVWVEKYDVHEAPDRRVARLIEKENKKERDKEKRNRNEIIRELVKFVRKRDPRVQSHREKLTLLAMEQAEKAAQKRTELIRSRIEETALYAEKNLHQTVEHANRVSELENLMKEEFGFSTDEEEETDENAQKSSDEESEHVDELYCVACNKHFKTTQAVKNHEKSKKHKDKFTRLQAEMKEETELDEGLSAENNADAWDSDEAVLPEQPKKLSKKQKKQRRLHAELFKDDVDGLELPNLQATQCTETPSNEDALGDDISVIEDTVIEKPEHSTICENKQNLPKTKRKKQAKSKNINNAQTQSTTLPPKNNFCGTCNREYPSRNKLFQHLKSSGHAMIVQDQPKGQRGKKKK